MIAQVLIAAFIIALFMFIAFYIGYGIGKSMYTIKDIHLPQKIEPTEKTAGYKEQETEAQRVDRIFRENIENYGTAKPQQEV